MSKKHGIRESIMMHYTAETTQQWAAIQHFSFFLKHISVFAWTLWSVYSLLNKTQRHVTLLIPLSVYFKRLLTAAAEGTGDLCFEVQYVFLYLQCPFHCSV